MSASAVPVYFAQDWRPVADPTAVVALSNVRFTALTPRLLRLEYSPNGRFEDRPSQTFWHREQPVDFSIDIEQVDTHTILRTPFLELNYSDSPAGFTPNTLTISSRKGQPFSWRYGDADTDNLLGTTKTLDQIDGAIDLDPGLVSRSGWTLVDDSHTLIFDERGWIGPRLAPEGSLDLYFFGYGTAFADCLADFARVAGRAQLFPRYILGNWWSRYHAYTQAELQGLMEEFQERDVPLAVCIIDMDWHLVEEAHFHSGWTGYTWNRKLFPDPAGFLDWLHAQGLRTALNLHPAAGVAPHEEIYPEMRAAVGENEGFRRPVQFQLTNPTFAKPYLELLHHPQEEMGVDFWWLDWQQGNLSGLEGLDPLWWLNHVHYVDLGRDGVKRPFIFSRWGGLGNHRYPIGFSGDTRITWASLAFQPTFTATAANVGYGWWSHDIGGHYAGIADPELYLRWVQYGVFSPIFRLHASKGEHARFERRPWAFPEPIASLAQEALWLRHQFIPYLYTMAERFTRENLALCLPLYYLAPEAEEAYACPQAYLFGSELIAAPITAPVNEESGTATQQVWFPSDGWIDFFDGRVYGAGWHTIEAELDVIPLFVKPGGILPLANGLAWSETGTPEILDVHLFPGDDNRFSLYEDDGETVAYTGGELARTPITQTVDGDQRTITYGPVEGETGLVPQQRIVRLIVIGAEELVSIRVDGADVDGQIEQGEGTLILTAVDLPPEGKITAVVR